MDNNTNEDDGEKSSEDIEIESKAEIKETRAKIMYDKGTYTLNPSNMRATEYKYNKKCWTLTTRHWVPVRILRTNRTCQSPR